MTVCCVDDLGIKHNLKNKIICIYITFRFAIPKNTKHRKTCALKWFLGHYLNKIF